MTGVMGATYSAAIAAVASIAAAASLAPAETASGARTHGRSVAAAETTRLHATFRLTGVRPRSIVRARLRVGGHSRRLGVARARAGARRGTLRTRLSRHQRRAARLRARRPVLVLRLATRRMRGGSTTPAQLPAVQRIAAQPPALPAAAQFTRPYASTSPWNQRIAAGAAADPNSKRMVRSLVRARAAKGFPLSVTEWTVPTYFADASTPRHDVVLRKAPPRWTDVYGTPGDFVGPPPGWITDPIALWAPRTGVPAAGTPTLLADVPIPSHARPDPELDGHMTVIDRSTGCEYDFYAAHRGGGGWQALWANSTRIDGSGVYPQGLSSKASGFAGVAGLVWPEELRAGRIDHALFMSFPHTKAGGPVAPATASDAKTVSAEAIPQGARIQLDPSLNLDSLGLQPYERTVATALQEYGMIVGDTGGAMGLFAIHPQSYENNPYAGILPDGPYAYLDKIPVSRFRVLELAPQQRRLSLRVHGSGCSAPR